MAHIPVDFMRKDVTLGQKRHLIFATDLQLMFLRKAKTWYIDGTFEVVREPFKQLFTIHAFVRKDNNLKQVPLLYVLMSSRKAKHYAEVFQKIKQIFSDTNQELRLERVISDFERGMWKAVREVLGVEIKGCFFHWTQAVWRKIQENAAHEYANDNAIHKYLRKLLALPLLPHEHIRPAFDQLAAGIQNPRLVVILDYIRDTWINSNTWPIPSWCVFRESIRTNNDLESWHNRFNARAGRKSVPFYQLISMFQEESRIVTFQITLVANYVVIREQRASARIVQGRLFQLWDRYETQNPPFTTNALLSACSHIIGFQ